MKKLNIIYQKLRQHFGPQLWWPITEEGKLHPEYSGGPNNEKLFNECHALIVELGKNIYKKRI